MPSSARARLVSARRGVFNTFVDFAPSDAKAEGAARRALALDSTSADAHAALGFRAIRQFDFTQAAAQMATARRLEPLSATTLNTRARMLTERRQFVRAHENDARAASLSATFSNSRVVALIWAGMADSAFRVTRRIPASDRRRIRLGNAIMAAAAAGQWDVARALQREIGARGAEVRSIDRAAAAALFVDNLERDDGLANRAFSVCDPPYDGIRAEPVWKAFSLRGTR